MHILVADDDTICRRITESILRKWGHSVVTALDGQQAWDILSLEDAPWLVILDWIMPRMEGIDVCRRLRAIKRPVRPFVILLSGMEAEEHRKQAMEAGADVYLVKPFVAPALYKHIENGRRRLELEAKWNGLLVPP